MKSFYSILMRLRPLVLVGFALAVGVTAPAQERMIVFGDSLSDPGNLFAHNGEASRPPFLSIPSAPYVMGGHHFSNGATWVERLAKELGDPRGARPALRNPGQFTNYAFGLARARPGATVTGFGLSAQVALFLSDFGDVAPTDATYVVWIGSNDARDALLAGGDPTIVGQSVTAIATNIALLANQGARKFVVLNVPDLGLVPAVNRLPAPTPALATGFSLAYNQALSSALDTVEPGLMALGGEIVRVDTFAILNTLVANPDANGFSNTMDSCLALGVRGRFLQGTPNEFLFWDGIHPTAAGHAAFERAVLDVLERP